MSIPPFFLLSFFLSFALLYGKDKNLTLEQLQAGAGSLWTWTALDADTKLMVSYTLGIAGPLDLERRVSCLTWRGESPTGIPLTTDGHHLYAERVEDRLGADIDYAMRVEIYGASTDNPDSRYSPPPASDAVPTSRPIPRAFRITRMPSFTPCAPARWELAI